MVDVCSLGNTWQLKLTRQLLQSRFGKCRIQLLLSVIGRLRGPSCRGTSVVAWCVVSKATVVAFGWSCWFSLPPLVVGKEFQNLVDQIKNKQ